MRAVLLLALLAVLLPPTLLSGQRLPLDLREGERIRIAGPTLAATTVDATVVRVEPEWLGFRLEGQEELATRRLEFVDRVEVQRRRSARARGLRGAAWGLFMGMSAGGMSAPFITYGIDAEVEDWQAVGMGAGVGALAGAGIGALAGMLLPGRYWQRFEIVRAR